MKEKTELPTARDRQAPPKQWRGRLPLLLLGLLTYALLTVNKQPSTPRPSPSEVCPQPKAYALSELEGGPPSRQELGRKLSGAVAVDTSVGDDWPLVEEDPQLWSRIFTPFQEYLKQSFPRIHAEDSPVDLTLINQHGLLYEWEGTNTTLKPIMLMAHQDVVPVEPHTVDQWTYPPFGGYYDESKGLIWGRGAADTKASIIAILASLESLVESEFKPTRTVIVSFGFDEESEGTRGAGHLSPYLEEKYGRDSIAVIVDEGDSIEPADEAAGIPAVAGVAVGEKGYLDVTVRVATKGGHSSEPTEHTSIGFLSAVIVALEKNPHAPVLRTEEAAFKQLLCSAALGQGVSKPLEKVLYEILAMEKRASSSIGIPLRLDKWRLEKAKARALSLMSRSQRFAFQTTQAVDLITGGVKINALPEEASAIVNHRIEPGSSVREVQKHIAAVVRSVAKEMELEVDAFGDKDLGLRAKNSARGTVTLQNAFGSGLEPSPRTPLAGKPAKLVSGVIRSTWPSGLAENSGDPHVRFVPSLMGGNTDTSRYWNLSKHIFRFSPGISNVPAGVPAPGNVHTVDEREMDLTLVHGWRFYTTIIRASSIEEL